MSRRRGKDVPSSRTSLRRFVSEIPVWWTQVGLRPTGTGSMKRAIKGVDIFPLFSRWSISTTVLSCCVCTFTIPSQSILVIVIVNRHLWPLVVSKLSHPQCGPHHLPPTFFRSSLLSTRYNSLPSSFPVQLCDRYLYLSFSTFFVKSRLKIKSLLLDLDDWLAHTDDSFPVFPLSIPRLEGGLDVYTCDNICRYVDVGDVTGLCT